MLQEGANLRVARLGLRGSMARKERERGGSFFFGLAEVDNAGSSLGDGIRVAHLVERLELEGLDVVIGA